MHPMPIRTANANDIPALLEHFRIAHPHSVFKHLSIDEAKFRANLQRMIGDTSGAFCFLVADDPSGKLCGVLVGQIDSYYFSSDPVAKMVFYWVPPDHRHKPHSIKLMLAFHQWAIKRQAKELQIAVTSGENIERSDRMFKKMGGRLVGGNYLVLLGTDGV